MLLFRDLAHADTIKSDVADMEAPGSRMCPAQWLHESSEAW